jgi:hypothetical protein
MLRNARLMPDEMPDANELRRITMLKKMLIACHKYF